MRNHEDTVFPFFRSVDQSSLNPFVKNYSGPAFIYSKKIIENQYQGLKDCIPPKFNIFFAQKSNPNPKILKLLSGLNAGCDTASGGEIRSALKAGFPNKKVMLTGPGKSKEELELAVENDLLSVNVESLQEAELLNEICQQSNKVQNILVRINPGFEAGETNRIIGGKGVSKFGIDIDQLPDFFEKVKALQNIKITGIHIFNSSQILDWNKIYINVKNVIDTAINIKEKYSIEIKHIDLGGGFGIQYSSEDNELDIKKLGTALYSLLEEKKYSSFLKNVELIFEPGRFLTGECGIYIMKVLYTKISGGVSIAITDGGIHHMIRPALIGHEHTIVNLSANLNKQTNKKKNYLIAGPLCTSIDQFSNSALIDEIVPGDILAILNAGAYGYTESMPLFLSHKPASEHFVN